MHAGGLAGPSLSQLQTRISVGTLYSTKYNDRAKGRALPHVYSAKYSCDCVYDLMSLLGAPDLQSVQKLDVCFHVMQVDWGKGRALSHMLKALSLDDCDDVIPIYLGDDRTDEDAFKVLKQRASGFGVLISNKVSQPNTLPAMHACTLAIQPPCVHASLLIS